MVPFFKLVRHRPTPFRPLPGCSRVGVCFAPSRLRPSPLASIALMPLRTQKHRDRGQWSGIKSVTIDAIRDGAAAPRPLFFELSGRVPRTAPAQICAGLVLGYFPRSLRELFERYAGRRQKQWSGIRGQGSVARWRQRNRRRGCKRVLCFSNGTAGFPGLRPRKFAPGLSWAILSRSLRDLLALRGDYAFGQHGLVATEGLAGAVLRSR